MVVMNCSRICWPGRGVWRGIGFRPILLIALTRAAHQQHALPLGRGQGLGHGLSYQRVYEFQHQGSVKGLPHRM